MIEGALTQNDVQVDGWNEARVVARGPRLVFSINARVASEVIDYEVTKRVERGVIGLQLHAGHPMKIPFRDLHIRRLEHR